MQPVGGDRGTPSTAVLLCCNASSSSATCSALFPSDARIGSLSCVVSLFSSSSRIASCSSNSFCDGTLPARCDRQLTVQNNQLCATTLLSNLGHHHVYNHSKLRFVQYAYISSCRAHSVFCATCIQSCSGDCWTNENAEIRSQPSACCNSFQVQKVVGKGRGLIYTGLVPIPNGKIILVMYPVVAVV